MHIYECFQWLRAHPPNGCEYTARGRFFAWHQGSVFAKAAHLGLSRWTCQHTQRAETHSEYKEWADLSKLCVRHRDCYSMSVGSHGWRASVSSCLKGFLMRSRLVVLLALLTGCLVCNSSYADPPTEKPATPVTPLMQMKLEKAKAILEGLSVEDFDKIARNARSLKLLSLESGWNVVQTEEYMTQSRDFRRATDMIVQAAEEKNIDRAALGYVSLTVRCVECHSYMRKRQAVLR